jgi:hypothetical protein
MASPSSLKVGELSPLNGIASSPHHPKERPYFVKEEEVGGRRIK